jgi:hypothetical protein
MMVKGSKDSKAGKMPSEELLVAPQRNSRSCQAARVFKISEERHKRVVVEPA